MKHCHHSEFSALRCVAPYCGGHVPLHCKFCIPERRGRIARILSFDFGGVWDILGDERRPMISRRSQCGRVLERIDAALEDAGAVVAGIGGMLIFHLLLKAAPAIAALLGETPEAAK